MTKYFIPIGCFRLRKCPIILFVIICFVPFKVYPQKTTINGLNSSNKKRKTVPIIIDGEKRLYVIDRNGAQEKYRPDSSSWTRVNIDYGQLVEVRRIKENWVEVGPKEYATGYIRIEQLGNEDNFTWQDSDLFGSNGSRSTFGAFKLEFVTEKEFFKKSNKAFNHFKADSNLVKKNNGILELDANNQALKLIDRPNYRQIFKYIGQYPNMYVVLVSSWEHAEPMLIDRITGKRLVATIPADDTRLPYILVDHKHVIAFSGLQGCGINLFELEGDTIKHVESNFFQTWNTVSSGNDALLFWGKDNSFYFAITPSIHLWYSKSSLTKKRLRELRKLYGYVKLTLVDNK
jgi:hypothetical protein